MPVLTRRQLLWGSPGIAGLGLLSGCRLLSVPGLRPADPRRVGFLESGTTSPSVDAFRDGMRELGYLEGQGFVLEYRSAEGNLGRLPDLVNELVDEILKGARPGDLPIGLPAELTVVNLEAARALGITIPRTVLTRVTEILE